MQARHLTIFFFIVSIQLFACKKAAFLDTKPDQNLIVPTTLEDCQALMDNDVAMNGYGSSGFPALLENGTDDFYVSSAQFAGYSDADQQTVIWAAKIYSGADPNDWDLSYRTVFYANETLDVLAGIHPAPDKTAAWDRAEGSAFFFRAFAFYQLAQVFAPPYDSSAADKPTGILLRKSADISEKLKRSTLKETYDQIISDLQTAIPLLTEDPSSYPTRPSRAAAYGLLARTFLCVYNYTAALAYADSSLQLRHDLMDYNTISQTSTFPFTRNNSEVIFAAAYVATGPGAPRKSNTDSLLFASYQADDLRKKLYFKGGSYFFGKYDENGITFCGIAVDELYLLRAECQARMGNITAAMNDLDTLMIKRWTNGLFTPHTAANADDALQLVLMERRKELLFRGTRWTDLRRLNKEPRTATTLYRTIKGTVHTLPPNDQRYVYAIPDNVTSFYPGIPQNPR